MSPANHIRAYKTLATEHCLNVINHSIIYVNIIIYPHPITMPLANELGVYTPLANRYSAFRRYQPTRIALTTPNFDHRYI